MMIRSARCKAFCVFVLAAGTLLWAGQSFAAVRLARLFGDGMVLQREMPVPVWGFAKAGENVTVRFGGQEKSATADASGKWMVRLDAMPASASPREMTVAGENTLTLKDVLVGEVWLCGGQSNMEMTVNNSLNFDAEKAAATNSAIRQVKVPRSVAAAPRDDLSDSPGNWVVCAPATVGQFTAAGYFFAREIAKALDVPVGLINDCWGGTSIEPWTPAEGFRLATSDPQMRDISRLVDSWNPTTDAGQEAYRRYLAQVKEWLPAAEAAVEAKRVPPPAPKTPEPAPNNGQPTYLFNAMIAPVIPCAIRGAIWYQGEANGAEGMVYFHKMKALVGGWRQLWGQGDFPFYYVQLPGWQRSDPAKPAGGDGWAHLREAQLRFLAFPNTGMAVAIDLGEADEIHPKDKQDVGKRLALCALGGTYGKKIAFSGPLCKSVAVEGDKIRIAFDHAGGGLIAGEKKGLAPVQEAKDGKLKWFAIAGKDKVWYWADAVIDGQTVLVSSDKVPEPVAVRYAFAMNPEGANLYNKEGLPASPFRTDSW
ncbi:MAG: sialate O-acetylesterase [Candidatus Brocadiia bacterium]|jgi:sialate O-acetylesterase